MTGSGLSTTVTRAATRLATICRNIGDRLPIPIGFTGDLRNYVLEITDAAVAPARIPGVEIPCIELMHLAVAGGPAAPVQVVP